MTPGPNDRASDCDARYTTSYLQSAFTYWSAYVEYC